MRYLRRRTDTGNGTANVDARITGIDGLPALRDGPAIERMRDTLKRHHETLKGQYEGHSGISGPQSYSTGRNDPGQRATWPWVSSTRTLRTRVRGRPLPGS